LLKLLPADGVAVIETVTPLSLQLLPGLTVPPVPWVIVRKYCVLTLAV
jgi:hypothetical protein